MKLILTAILLGRTGKREEAGEAVPSMPCPLLIFVIGVHGLVPASLQGETPPMVPTTQVVFFGPEGMAVSISDGNCSRYDSERRLLPYRHNFPQGAVASLKLGRTSDRPAIELFSTLEVNRASSRTEPYLAKNIVPVTFSEEDINAVIDGKAVTKVVYLPAPEFKEVAWPVETIVSYKLDADADPIAEARLRGDIMIIVRIEAVTAVDGEHSAGDHRACSRAISWRGCCCRRGNDWRKRRLFIGRARWPSGTL